MAKRFVKLNRSRIRQLPPGEKIVEHGIEFERLPDGDGKYTVNIMVDGVRVHRTIGKESDGVTRLQAEQFIEKVRTDARNGRLDLPKGRKTPLGFKEATEKYTERLKQENGKDIKAKKYRLQHHIIPFCNEKPLDKIATFDIERYKKNRLEEDASPSTINRELSVISHLMNKAIEWGWIRHKSCVIKRLPEKSGRITYLTSEQADRLLETARTDDHPYIYLFIKIGLETGMRKMEILSIQISHIDTAKCRTYIPNAKAGDRLQPITRSLANFLEEHLNALTEGQTWLFPSLTSKKGHMMEIRKPFMRIVKKAGLDPEKVVRHTLRHTAITHLVQAGVDLPTVKRISGHKTLRMVERYAHQSGEHIQAAMDKLENRYRHPS